MDDETTANGFKPPYMSFQTFWSFLADLTSRPLPPVIDRSLLSTKSGSDQAAIVAALKGFGFIRDDQKVEPKLEVFAALDPDDRKATLGELIFQHYPQQMDVSNQNGTEKQLLDSFEEAFGYTGHTRRKAATFFLHAARTADIKLSAYFPVTRSGSGPSTPRKRTVARRKPETTTATTTTAPSGDTYKVPLECGGSVALTVSVSHFALSKNRKDRDFVNGLIDALTDYGDVETTEGAPVESTEEGTDEQ